MLFIVFVVGTYKIVGDSVYSTLDFALEAGYRMVRKIDLETTVIHGTSNNFSIVVNVKSKRL